MKTAKSKRALEHRNASPMQDGLNAIWTETKAAATKLGYDLSKKIGPKSYSRNRRHIHLPRREAIGSSGKFYRGDRWLASGPSN
jgi:hypothetical protein